MKKFLLFLCNFITLKARREWGRHAVRFGLCNYWKWIKAERTRAFEYYLGVVCIIKNEAPYLAEWVEYHRSVGVEKFFVYDNDSSDNPQKILEPYIRMGLVEYIPFPGDKRQLPAYYDALKRCGKRSKWLAFIDLDEFLVSLDGRPLPEVVRGATGNSPLVAQLLVTWRVFGSAGHKTKPQGLVLENYQYRAPDDTPTYTKFFLNPRAVLDLRVHNCEVLGRTVDENGKDVLPDGKVTSRRKICIHHYAVKSWEEFLEKSRRGDAYYGAHVQRSKEYFDLMDCNEVFDPVMNRYIPQVKRVLGHTGKQ